MPDIVISEFMDQRAIDSLAADFDLVYDPQLVDRHDDLLAAVASARALVVRNRTQVRGELLQAAPALRVVGRLGVGLDNIDVVACHKLGIRVCPATGANDTAVAEYVIATAMTLLRGAYAASDAVIRGHWPRQASIGREIAGKVLGLVGFGGIARETAQRALALGMEVIAHDPFVDTDDPAWAQAARENELFELLGKADVISLHVPMTENTHNIIDTDAFAAMKPDAVLINTARGGVVEESALIDALKKGHLGGAALDVFVREPMDAETGAAFSSLPNLILTPHIAGVTGESNVRVSAVTAENVRNALEDKQ